MSFNGFDRPLLVSEGGGEPHAVQTLRVMRMPSLIAKRLDCGCFSTAFRPSQATAPAKSARVFVEFIFTLARLARMARLNRHG